MARLALMSALGLGRFCSLVNSIRERYRMDYYRLEYYIQGYPGVISTKEFKARNQELAIQRAEKILETEKQGLEYHRPFEGGQCELFLMYALGELGGPVKPLRLGAWGEGGLTTYRVEFEDCFPEDQEILEAQTPAEALQKAQAILDESVEVVGRAEVPPGQILVPTKGHIMRLLKLIKVWEGTKPRRPALRTLAKVTTIMRMGEDVIEVHEKLKPKRR